MTDENSAAIAVTDAQVNTFFESEGKTLDSQPEIEQNTEEKATKAQEPKKDSQPEGEKKDDKSENKVNYGALHEERMRRKEAAERAKKAEERAAALEEQLKRYAQPQEPSYDDDPVETMRRKQEMIEKVLIAQANQTMKQKQDQEYWGRVAESEAAFKRDKPDFDDAAKFLAESRLKELTQHIGFSEQEAQKILADEVKWISDKAYADEVNPAERFYNLALARGFTPAQAQQAVEQNNAISEKLDRIEKGMKTNRSLPPASKSLNSDLTAEALADMNVDALSNLRGDTDFDKAWKKLFG